MNRHERSGNVPHPWVVSILRATVGVQFKRTHEVVAENMDIIPIAGAVIALANHRSDSKDAKALGVTVKRKFRYPAKVELDKGLKGRALEASGAIYFDREDEEDRKRVGRVMTECVDHGAAVLNFWEGTSKNRGQQLGDVNMGPVALALRKRLPLYMIALAGTEEPGDGMIHVVTGQPLDTEQFLGSRGQSSKMSRDACMEVALPTHQELINYAYQQLADRRGAAEAARS